MLGYENPVTIDKQSPYWNKDGFIETRNSVVAFVDLLGYRKAIRQADTKKKASDLLELLRRALDNGYVHLRHPLWPDRRPWEVRAFTDNILVSYPIHGSGDSEMQSVLSSLGSYQLEMIRNGFFVRGGIAVGELYIDQDLIFGLSSIQAYEAESKKAINPRIVLDKSALECVKKYLEIYGRIERSPESADLLQDEDGEVFLNYLQHTLVIGQEPGLLLEHKKMIEGRLEQFADCPRIWDKYWWAAQYHNYFCDISGIIDEDNRISHSGTQICEWTQRRFSRASLFC